MLRTRKWLPGSMIFALVALPWTATSASADDWRERREEARERWEEHREDQRERWEEAQEDYEEAREEAWEDYEDRLEDGHAGYRPPGPPQAQRRYFRPYDAPPPYERGWHDGHRFGHDRYERLPPPRRLRAPYRPHREYRYYGTPRFGYFDGPHGGGRVRIGPLSIGWH